MSRSYVLGAMHDGTSRPRTFRISQREEAYVLFLRDLVQRLGGKAWTYREGARRNLYVVEFSRSFLEGHSIRSRREKIDYVRGYFDADGSIGYAKPPNEMYVYFCQKSVSDLEEVRRYLTLLGIESGRIHNPSWRVDPDYWRFYVRRRALPVFARLIGSWHPRKAVLVQAILEGRRSTSTLRTSLREGVRAATAYSLVHGRPGDVP